MEEVLLKTVKLPNGEEYGYRQIGNGSRVILLIHGGLMSSRHWKPLLTAFGPGYKVVAPDLRGCGNSSYKRPVNSLADWAYDIKLFCDEIGLEIFTMVGWSIGGGVGLRFVSSYPGYAKRLILYGSIPCSGYPLNGMDNKASGCLEYMPGLIPVISAIESNDRAYMRYIWDNYMFSICRPDEKEYEALLDDIFTIRSLKDAARAASQFNIAHPSDIYASGSGEIDRIGLPVLVLAGDRDTVIPLHWSKFNVQQIGENAKFEILDNCSHTPHYCNLEAVKSKIEKFINE